MKLIASLEGKSTEMQLEKKKRINVLFVLYLAKGTYNFNFQIKIYF